MEIYGSPTLLHPPSLYLEVHFFVMFWDKKVICMWRKKLIAWVIAICMGLLKKPIKWVWKQVGYFLCDDEKN